MNNKRQYLKDSIVRLIYYLHNHTEYKANSGMKPTDKSCEIIFELLNISGMFKLKEQSFKSSVPQYIRSIIQEKVYK